MTLQWVNKPVRKPMRKMEMCHSCDVSPATYYEHPIIGDDVFYYAACNDCWRAMDDCDRNDEKNRMKINVYEKYDGSKLVAFLVAADGSQRELLRSDFGNDDLLNKIEAMGLSHLSVVFHWRSDKGGD